MKRKENANQRVEIRTLTELDALVGKFLTGEVPRIHWISSHSEFRFDSIEEAVEAVNDPFFRQFSNQNDTATTVLTEVREFRRYSAELETAWELVENLSHRLEPLLVRRDGDAWESAFGNREFVSGPTAPVAICLAALRTRGVEVEFCLTRAQTHAAAGIADAAIKSYFAR